MAARKSELVITCNAKGVQNIMNFLNEKLAGIKQRLQEINNEASKNGWTAQMEKDFKQLTQEATGIDNIINRNQETMKKYGEVMKDLSNSKLKDLKKALQEGRNALGKMSENDPKRQRLISELEKIAKEMKVVQGAAMSMKEATRNLKDLGNVSFDRLKQGLDAINERLNSTKLKAKDRTTLQGFQQQYQAEIAYRQAQTTVSNRPVYGLNTQQLRAEQAALNSAIGQMNGVKGYEKFLVQYKLRLQEVNEQLKMMSEYEKMASDNAKQLQATQEAAKTVQQVYRGQEVSLENLNKAYQILQARAQQFAGVNPAKAQAATRQMEMLQQRIQQVNSAMLSEKDIQDRIAHSGKYTVQQLQEAYNQLQAKLQTLHTNDIVAIKRTQQQMKLLQKEINRTTGQVTGFAKAWQTAKQNIMMYVGVFAIVNKIKTTISDLVTKNKELSDSMANIRKVSQWASADVVKLTENLAKIDTRNTITTLQNLAYQGAKLGIGQYGVEGLTGFVRAAEQVQTALGEDLGEEALPALAKLTEVMGLIPKFGVEQAMQKAGSVIYQLGATSTATGANIVEFSKRLMGLANVSGVTADQLLGLGSAADSMALMPEVAATAFNKLFNSIHGNTENIAKAVGIAKEELQGLLYEGKTMEALVKVFEKMQTMSMKELEGRGVFKELGSDGARLTNVMITMSNKVDMLKSHLETAHEAFSEGKAVINEYLIQQETAAAYFDRAANVWTKAFVNPEGVDVVKQLAQEWYNVSYEMTHSATTMASIKLTLESIAGVVKLLITHLPTLIQLMMAYGVGSALQGIYLQYRAIYSAATMAGTATARFNALLKTNAIALAITAALMLAAKMYEVAEASKAAAAEEEKRQRIFTDAAAEALQTYNEQIRALQKYDEALKKSNTAEDERNEIIRKFKEEFGTYLEKLGIEVNTYDDMATALKRVNKELKDKAYYETGQKLRESYVGDAKSTQTNALSQFMQAAQKYDLPTKLMEDIVEGKVKTVDEAMQRISDYQMSKAPTGTKVYNTNKFGGWQAVRANENKDVVAKIKDFIFGNKTPKTDQETTDIYKAINNLVTATREVNTRETQVTKFLDQYAGNYSPQISVEGALLNLKKLKELNEEKLNEGLNVLRDKWKEMSENERKTDSQKGGQGIGAAIDAYSKQIRALRGEGYTPPPTKKELTAAQKKEKADLKDQMEEAEKDSTAVINAIEEFYRLQESAVEQLVADGKMTREEADKLIEYVRNRKDKMLMNARRAIAGKDSDFEDLRKTMGEDMLRPGDANSQRALNTVQTIDVAEAARRLQKFDGSKAVYDLNSGSFTQAMLKNAAQNELNIQRRQAAVQQEIDKVLLQYQFVEQAQRDFGKNLVKLGLVTDGYDKVVQQLADGTEIVANTREVQSLANKVVGMGSRLYAANPESSDALKQLIQDVMTDAEGKPESFASIFPSLSAWMKHPDEYKEQMRSLYEMMIQYEGTYYDKLKQRDDLQRKRLDSWWDHSDQKKANDKQLRNLQLYDFQYNTMNEGQTMGFMMGLTNDLSRDPEVMREQAILEQKIAIWKKAKEEREANLISEQVYQERLQAMQDQSMNYSKKVMENINNRISRIQNMVKPVETAAKSIGQKLGDMILNMESDSATWDEIWKNMALAVAESLMSMIGQYAQYQITKSAINKSEIADEAVKAQAITMLGISSGAAKTIGTLGWWGIALIPVITQLLMGLLSSALNTASKSTGASSNNTKTGTNTRIVSNMLTYDAGNIQHFIGQDGRVYAASVEPAPRDGLITHPIATTVQGQPALVAEKGPEIVLGRETTRAIMMNEPELIRYLANYQQHGGRRLFDDGTPFPVAATTATTPDGFPSGSGVVGEDARTLIAAIATFNRTVEQMQQKGIPCYINKYGTGGLIDEVKSGLKFDQRYGG